MSARGRSGMVVTATITLVLIAGLVYRYRPDDERDIKRHLSNLAEALSVSTAESEVQTATRFSVMQEYFAPEARVRFDGQEVAPRDAILGRLSRWTPPSGGISVEFLGVVVSLAPDRNTATVHLSSTLSTNQLPASTSVVETRAVAAELVRRDGDWLIVSVDAGPVH